MNSMIKKFFSKIYHFFVKGNKDVIFFYTLSKYRHQKIYRFCGFLLWFYLIFLVIKYRFLKADPKKSLPISEREFKLVSNKTALRSKLAKAEVISLDVFDTLLLRRVTEPKEVFDLVGHKIGVLNYRVKREFAEYMARTRSKSGEASLDDICRNLEELYGIDALAAYREELNTEREICVGNPFFIDLINDGLMKGKHVIAVSDMYLPSDFIRELLKKNGFDISEIYVSCEHDCSKADSGLWKLLRNKFRSRRLLHVGDNYRSDMKICGKNGIDFVGVPSPSWLYRYYRECGVVSKVMSIYAEQVNRSHIQESTYSEYYDHGYIYGGILTYGFCHWLDRLAREHSYDLLLFTARDCKVFHEVYEKYFGGTRSAYLYTSRFAALKLSFEKNFESYFDIMFRSKFKKGQKLTIGEVLKQAGLDDLIVAARESGIDEQQRLSEEALQSLCVFLSNNQTHIEKAYEEDRSAFSKYIGPIIGSAKRICIIDLGWRGTVYSLLKSYFSVNRAELQVYGAMLGTSNSEIPNDLTEAKEISSYAFSHQHNTNYLVNPKEIILLEILYSSSKPSVTGYRISEGEGVPVFGQIEEPNDKYFDDMHKGIYGFCEEFDENMKLIPYIREITGAEAVAPISTICKNKRYNARLFDNISFSLEANLSADKVAKQLKMFN